MLSCQNKGNIWCYCFIKAEFFLFYYWYLFKLENELNEKDEKVWKEKNNTKTNSHNSLKQDL